MYAAKHARAFPDKPAIVMATGGEVVTFAAYESASNQVAHLLRDAGMRRRDHVAIFMDNDYRMLLCEGGAERAGLFYTCVNSYLSAEEVAYIINDSQSRVVMTSAAKAEVAHLLPDLCPNVERWLMTGTVGAGAGPFESWEEAISLHPTDSIADEQMGAPMMYSSGTTGRPKGILRPLGDTHPGQDLPGMTGIMALWKYREGMVYLSPAPLYHTAPQVSVALALRLGATVVVMEHFDAAQYLEEAIIHAAAPCPVPVKEQMIAWLGPILLEYYAATEGNGCTFCDSETWLAHKGTVGRAVLGRVQILDDDGKPAKTGTPGTVWFSGATSFQ